jgi:hypothetical protein
MVKKEQVVKITLRQLITERVLFAVDAQELQNRYQLAESDVNELTDIDLFELYETVVVGA